MDGTNRSSAKWRANVDELQEHGIIERVGEGIYRLAATGYELVDREIAREEQSEPTEISLEFTGTPDNQILRVRSNRVLALGRIDFLLSSGACITTQKLEGEGEEVSAKISYEKITELFNSPRSDSNHFDLSGPAKLRLAFRVKDKLREVVLPVFLRPRIVGNTHWVTLVGSQEFQLEG